MALPKTRLADNGGGEYKARSVYERYKTIFVLIGALTGGTISGVGVKFYNMNEVNQTPARVELLEERMSSYMESQVREGVLKNLLIQNSLTNIKEDLMELKEENEKVNLKLDAIEDLIRNGNPQ